MYTYQVVNLQHDLNLLAPQKILECILERYDLAKSQKKKHKNQTLVFWVFWLQNLVASSE